MDIKSSLNVNHFAFSVVFSLHNSPDIGSIINIIFK